MSKASISPSVTLGGVRRHLTRCRQRAFNRRAAVKFQSRRDAFGATGPDSQCGIAECPRGLKGAPAAYGEQAQHDPGNARRVEPVPDTTN
jgi:hypothetical protein